MKKIEDREIIEMKKIVSKILKGEHVDCTNLNYDIEVEKNRLYSSLNFYGKNDRLIIKIYIDLKIDETLEINDDNYLLPVGSVVHTKGETVVIVSRYVIEADDVIDYLVVKYPEGLVSGNLIKLNHHSIDQILHVGYESGDEILLVAEIKKQLDSIRL